MTLAAALLTRGRANALNLVRLALATLVIVGHTWPLGGFEPDSPIGSAPVSEWAVAGFFCVSGFLIASSRVRLSFPRFMWHRALRILPGFWVCLVVVAFVFAPVAALLTSDSYEIGSAFRYVTHNAALYIFQPGVEATLQDIPYPTAWDGSLWTLVYEFLAYIAAGLVLTGWLRRHPAATSAALLAAVLALGVLVEGHVSTQLILRGLYLGSFFLAGMTVYGIADRLPVSWLLMALATGCLFVVMITGVSAVWGALPLAYVVLWLGAVLPASWAPGTDVSYGVYIYAFPVQQSLALAGVQDAGVLTFMALSIVLTVPLAWASWEIVEGPALLMKQWNPARARGSRKPADDRGPEPVQIPGG